MSRDTWETEALTIRIIGILVVLCLTGVVVFITAAVKSSTAATREKDQQVKVSCIEHGGTWVGSTPQMCINPKEVAQ